MNLQNIRELIDGSEYADAALSLEQWLKARPDDAEGYAIRGDIKRMTFPADMDGAKEDYQTAIRLSPECASAYAGSGWLAHDGEALKLFTIALSMDANNTSAMCGIASVLYKSGQTNNALGYLDKAIILAPDSLPLYRTRSGMLRSLKEPDWCKAFDDCMTILSKTKNKRKFCDSDAFFSSAIKSGKTEQATDAILPIIDDFPRTASFFDFLVHLGRINLEKLELLFQNGLSPDAALAGRDILFHRFIASGNCSAVELCLKYNADPASRRDDGATALYIAIAECDNIEIGKKLLKCKSSPIELGKDNITPLMVAISQARKPWFDLFLRHKIDLNIHLPYSPMTYLQLACSGGDQYFVKRMIACGAEPNFAGYGGMPPLDFLKKLKSHQEITEQKYNSIYPLLANGTPAGKRPAISNWSQIKWTPDGKDHVFCDPKPDEKKIDGKNLFITPWAVLFFEVLILPFFMFFAEKLLLPFGIVLLGTALFLFIRKKRNAIISIQEEQTSTESTSDIPEQLRVKSGGECPYCASPFETQPEYFGRKANCYNCGRDFRLYPTLCLSFTEIVSSLTTDEELRVFISPLFKMRETIMGKEKSQPYTTLTAKLELCGNAEIRAWNENLPWQLYFLFTLALARRIPVSAIAELRDYYAEKGADVAVFDTISAKEITKAFIALHQDPDDFFAALPELDTVSTAYCTLISGDGDIKNDFSPVSSALASWYYTGIIEKLTPDNCFRAIDDIEKIASSGKFAVFADIIADEKFIEAITGYFVKRIISNSNAEWEKIKQFYHDHPEYMAKVFESDVLKRYLSKNIIGNFKKMCNNGKAKNLWVDVNFELPYTSDDIEVWENEMADILMKNIIAKHQNKGKIDFLIQTLHRYNFGYTQNNRLFSICRIMPFVISGNSNDFLSIHGLMAEQSDIPCPSCRAFGLTLCPRCGGTGKMPCPNCDGEGEVPGTRKAFVMCMKCGGRKEMTCSNGCLPKNGPDGQLKRYIVCSDCNAKKYVLGGKTIAGGELVINNAGCFFRAEKGDPMEIAFPLAPFKVPYTRFDDAIKKIMTGTDSITTMATASGQVLYLDLKSKFLNEAILIEILNGYFWIHENVEKTAISGGTAINQRNAVGKDLQLSDNECKYIKAYKTAISGGGVAEAERALLNFQAKNIYGLADERIADIERMISIGEI